MVRAWAVVFVIGCSSDPLVGGIERDAPGPTATATAPAPVDDTPLAPASAYPSGPYGRGLGAVIEDLAFLGWRDPVAASYDPALLEIVRLSDFHDPTGTRTKLIVLNASAVWCTVCQFEMQDIRQRNHHQGYLARGAQIVGTLFEDGRGGPATPQDLELWGSRPTHEIGFPLLLDPGFKLSVYFTSDATPLNLIIDATTMRILQVMMGYSSSPSAGLWALVDRELERRGVPAP
jgi:hypothetical protein